MELRCPKQVSNLVLLLLGQCASHTSLGQGLNRGILWRHPLSLRRIPRQRTYRLSPKTVCPVTKGSLERLWVHQVELNGEAPHATEDTGHRIYRLSTKTAYPITKGIILHEALDLTMKIIDPTTTYWLSPIIEVPLQPGQ